MREVEPHDYEYTREDLIEEGTLLSLVTFGCSFDEAHERVKKGELEGTLFASKIKRIAFLLESYT